MSPRPTRLIALCAAAAALAACAELDVSDPDTEPETGWAILHSFEGTARVPYTVLNGQAMIDDDLSIGRIEDVRATAWSAAGTSASELAKRWDDGIVYYAFDTNITVANQATILAGLSQWGATTAGDKWAASRLTFLPMVSGQNYILYSKDLGATGSGWTEGTATGFTVHLGDSFGAKTAAHETGHALGVFHEQRRQDRDSFVIYHDECYVPPGNGLQPFAKINWTNAVKLSTYDLGSVMQYSSYGFNLNANCPTLLAKAGAPADCSVFNFDTAGMPADCASQVITGGPGVSPEDINGVMQVYDSAIGAVEAYDMFGAAMVSADFDGDGYEDLAVGASGEAPFGEPSSGAVFVYKGTYSGLVAWKWLAPSDFAGVTPGYSDNFGESLAAAYPAGSSAATLFVGAPGAGNWSGAVFMYTGGPGGPAPAVGGYLTEAAGGGGSVEDGDRFGWSLAAGKLRGGSDLYLAAGAPYETSGGVQSGYVFVYKVTSSGFSYSQKFSSSGLATPQNFDRFGDALAAANVDGDGDDDLVIGAPNATSALSGAAFLMLGSSTGLSANKLIKGNNTNGGDRFGDALVFANYGGLELIVGAPGRDGSSGRVYAFSTSSWAQSQILDQVDAGATNDGDDNFGWALAAANLDGDAGGNDELIVAAPWDDVAGSNQGRVYVFRKGSDGKLASWYDRKRPSGSTSGLLGFSLGAGDFNGDGADDFAAGAEGWSSFAGDMDLIKGRAATTPTFDETRDQSTEHLL